MTFEYNVNKNTIEQDGKFVAYVNSVDGWRIANKLTALAKENEQLKKEAEEYNEDAMSYQTLYEQQLEKFEELLSECKHQQEQKMKLYKENEQLKKENNKLHQKIFEMRTNVALDRTEISRQSYTPKEFLDKIEKW